MADKVLAQNQSTSHKHNSKPCQQKISPTQNIIPRLSLISVIETQEASKGQGKMAQAMASVSGLRGSSQAVLEGSLQLSGSTRLNVSTNARVAMARPGLSVRAQQMPAEPETSRRAMLGLVAVGLASGSFVQAVLAEPLPIKLGPPPPPSGGLREFFIISTCL